MVVIRTSLFTDCSMDWTIKQKRQNRNMGYVIYIFALKVDFFYAVRAGTEQEENVENVSSDKEKKKQYVGF